jgi:hypothetical protein
MRETVSIEFSPTQSHAACAALELPRNDYVFIAEHAA